MDHQGHQGHQGKIIAIKIISSLHPRDLRRNFPTPFHLFP